MLTAVQNTLHKQNVEQNVNSEKISSPGTTSSQGSSIDRLHEKVIDNFMNGVEMKDFYTFRKVGNAEHIYETRNNCTELWLFKDNPRVKVEVCVARKIEDYFFGNSSGLGAMRSPKGELKWLGGYTKIQEVLTKKMPLVPFRLFDEQGMALTDLKIIDRGEEEWIQTWAKEPRHFMGAMLFRIEERHYLFDIDRGDLKHKNFNPFMVRLSRFPKTIEDAYKGLKPDEIFQAEAKGLECPRQGEWFFIPVEGEYEPLIFRGREQRASLKTGQSRPHYVEKHCKAGYVTGKVTHSGREHKPFELKGWYNPVPNTAIESWKLSGDVD